jgi:hypothetical protein
VFTPLSIASRDTVKASSLDLSNVPLPDTSFEEIENSDKIPS